MKKAKVAKSYVLLHFPGSSKDEIREFTVLSTQSVSTKLEVIV